MSDELSWGRTESHVLRYLVAAIALVLATGAAHAEQVSQQSQKPTASAGAQTKKAAAGNPKQLETIYVTAPHFVPSSSISASKSSVPLVEVPQSVSVVTRDQLDLLNLNDVQQAIRYTSGIVGEQFGPDLRYDFLTMRGFTPVEYVDGLQAPITTTIPSIGLDLYGFQEVDVLKGPSAALYGSSPPGGIYNLVSRRADDAFGADVGAIYGTFGYQELHGTVAGPITQNLDGRVTLLYRDQGDQVHFVKGKRIFFAPTFTWKIGEHTSFTGLAYYQNDDNRGDTNGFLPAYGTLLGNPNGVIPRSANFGEPNYNFYRRHQSGIGWEFDHSFSDHLSFVQNVKSYNYSERQNVVYGGGLAADMKTLYRDNFPYQETVRGWAADNRFTLQVGDKDVGQTLLAGYDYRNLRNLAKFGFAVAPSINAFDPVYGAAIVTPPLDFTYNNERIEQGGLYLQDQIKVHHVMVTLTGRHDDASLTNYQDGTTTNQDKFTYRAGVNYVFDSGLAPYVSYATSFQPTLGTDSVTGKPFVPSTAKQVEAGVKFDGRQLGPGVRIFATVALYKIEQDNLVSVQPGLTPVFGQQVGKVQAKGVELESVARINDQLSINASYTYAATKVLLDSSGFATGNPLPNMPRQKLTAFVDYTIASGRFAGLGFGIGGRYTSKSAGSLLTQFNPVVLYSKPVTLWDGAIHYNYGHWRFALDGTNLFDKTYVASCTSISDCTYGSARLIMATVDWKY